MRKFNINTSAAILAAVAIWAGASASANAGFTFTTSGTSADGSTITATATFDTSVDGKLTITLVNTSPGNTLGIADALYALTFSGFIGQSLSSAYAPVGSKLWDLTGSGPYTAKVVGSTELPEYYTTSWKLIGSPTGVTALGPPPAPPNQNAEGIIAGFSGTITDGLGNTQHNPFIEDSLVFVLNGTLVGDISNVQFGWGTSPSYTPGVPEPTTMIAGALLLLPFGASTLRILRKNRKA